MKGTPKGGQYSRESPRAASTSLTTWPSRTKPNTHSVLVGAPLPRRVRVAEVDRQARLDGDLQVLGQLDALA
jgi:hypothetical protein